jgi:hypothetical protein
MPKPDDLWRKDKRIDLFGRDHCICWRLLGEHRISSCLKRTRLTVRADDQASLICRIRKPPGAAASTPESQIPGTGRVHEDPDGHR